MCSGGACGGKCAMSRLPYPEVKFNELGDGVKVGDVHIRLEKCASRGLLGGFMKPQEYKLMAWSTTCGEDRFWSGKRFTP